MPNTVPNTVIDVAAAVLFNGQQQVLINQRPEGKPQAGFWEFPGGKLEAGESPHIALVRECHEELGIHILGTRPLIQLVHAYPSKTVRLHVLVVTEWTGEPQGLEGQPLHWLAAAELPQWNMLPADWPIVNAIRLPHVYAITGSDWNADNLHAALCRAVALQQTFIQFRIPKVSKHYEACAERMQAFAAEHSQLRWLMNHSVADMHKYQAHGLQLKHSDLMLLTERPIGNEYYLGASCHDHESLMHAAAIKCDFAVLSPVAATASHAGAAALGWNGFAELIADLALPVYALGGLSPLNAAQAWEYGAQGVAGIGLFWDDDHSC